MAKRLHEADKWDDKWFRSLNPHEKLVFLFLIDKCNLAGFYEVDYQDMAFRIGIAEHQIKLAFQGLNRGILGAKNNEWVWVKNFIKQQKNLPFNPLNNAHKHIIGKLYEQKENFSDVPEFNEFMEKELGANQGLISPIGKGIGIDKGKGKINVNDFEVKNDIAEIKKIWLMVYKTLPGIVETEFVDELITNYGIERAEKIVKELKSKGFNNVDTMKNSLDDKGKIKPRPNKFGVPEPPPQPKKEKYCHCGKEALLWSGGVAGCSYAHILEAQKRK